LVVTSPLSQIGSDFEGRIYGVSAINAPLGLKDRVRHRWTTGGREIYRSPYYAVTGGRTAGFRLWTSARIPPGTARSALNLWVETEAGQIIGRARLPISTPSGR
jgi:hypothetical protein